jgi:hypothetical protein
MSSLDTDVLIPLTLSEQLDAMLSGWLDRNAPHYDGEADGVAGGIVTVAEREVPEVEAFCERWGLVAGGRGRPPRGAQRRAVGGPHHRRAGHARSRLRRDNRDVPALRPLAPSA